MSILFVDENDTLDYRKCMPNITGGKYGNKKKCSKRMYICIWQGIVSSANKSYLIHFQCRKDQANVNVNANVIECRLTFQKHSKNSVNYIYFFFWQATPETWQRQVERETLSRYICNIIYFRIEFIILSWWWNYWL